MSKMDYIGFENYTYPELLKLVKDNPNDQQLGKKVRALLSEKQPDNFPGVKNL